MNKWWMVPAGMLGTGVVHSPEYKIKKKYLDLIQDHDEGVCLNPLMEVPGKGFTCFGNSTLWISHSVLIMHFRICLQDSSPTELSSVSGIQHFRFCSNITMKTLIHTSMQDLALCLMR